MPANPDLNTARAAIDRAQTTFDQDTAALAAAASLAATDAATIADLQARLDACEAANQPPPPPPPPAKAVLVGAAVQGNSYPTLAAFESTLGHAVDCYRSYGAAPSAAEVTAKVAPSKGKRRVCISFAGDPQNPSASYAGIDAANAALAALVDDVDVTMIHEPIRSTKPFTPQQWVAATNLWAPRFDAPNVHYGVIHTADNYKTKGGVVAVDAAGWPNMDFIDWIGADGYDWGVLGTDAKVIFQQAVAKAVALGKDLLIPEVGFDGANAGTAPASARPAKITGLFTYARANPVIKRVFYFDTHDPAATAKAAPNGNCHWELADAPSLAAYKAELVR